MTTNYRNENETKLAYWIFGIGYICWNKITKTEEAVYSTEQEASEWMNK